jgi:glutamate synthase (NADPH/NADH) large chain
MIPEAWQNDLNMDPNKRAFYEYLSNIMEPWDGPASITFTDGKYIGATLDRNGLRPSRFYLTKDDRVIMASEVGVVDIDAENVKHKGRLQPGKMFLIDFSKGKLIEDEDIKQGFANKKNYKKWISNQQITLDQIELNQKLSNGLQKDIINKLSFFSYSIETFQFMLLPLVTELRDPVGSMGNDSALACLSDKPRMIYDYFKQLFAQVTNPAIDSIREEVVMSLRCSIGPEANLLISEEKSAHRIVIDNPILTNKDFAKLKHINYMGWSSYVIDITYDINKANKFTNILDKICKEGLDAIKKGYSLLILSDKNVNKNRAAIPSLLAGGSLHQYLITKHARTKTGIIVETGEAREVHHFCSLIGFGVDAVNPYLAFDALSQARIDNMLDIESDEIIVNRYRKAIAKGMLKVMAKIGISTLESYKGAQIFEAIGLDDEVIDKCFCKTVSRVGGVGFDILQLETEKRHKESYANDSLSNSGLFHWRAGGEKHMWEPRTIFNLQTASRNYDINSYKEFSHHAQQQTNDCTLRGLMTFKKAKKIKLEEVEPAKEIVKRFSTGAMSFGSISAESHETLAIAMNRLEGKSNTGEGGEDSSRWERDTNGDSRRSAIKQVASGRFGVTIEYLNNSDEIQIKISQGAKPGEGGELPGKKVDEKIAKIRHSTPGVGLISPPPHHDIYSIEDLAQLIFDLKCSNPIARISVKLVSGVGVGTIAAGVVKAKADHIVIAGHDGGTGASPLTSIKHAGLPWELGLAETHQTLVMNNLRSRVIIQTDGQLKTGNDVAIAALLGAEEFGFSTAPLIVSGCIMMRKCHLNTCPVGIATQDEELRKKFTGKPEYLVNYFFMVAEELRGIMAELGFKNLNDMIGRSDMLSVANTEHWKKSTINLDDLFKSSQKNKQNIGNFNTIKQDHKLNLQIDNKLIVKAKKAIQNNENIVINEKINNQDRAVGAILSSHIIKTRKQNNMQDDTVRIKFNGSAGQSFGAFLAKGVTLEVEGDANDYVGKGLSGGKIIVYPPKKSSFDSHNEVIAGNVCVYGATNGEIYLSGRAAERFCVRNSGAMAVVEGIGDHGCEYMTGGIAIILGEVGRNFGAGMSGGIAYIYDKNNTFKKMYNSSMIDLEVVDDISEQQLQSYIEKHSKFTKSKIAKHILTNWDKEIKYFIKVMPQDLKRVLMEKEQQLEKHKKLV